jgi:anti-anti-sigma regulatory factor
MAGAVSDTHMHLKASYKRAGVKLSADKAVVRQTVVERMGSAVDGVLGHLSVPLDKCFNAVVFSLYL